MSQHQQHHHLLSNVDSDLVTRDVTRLQAQIAFSFRELFEWDEEFYPDDGGRALYSSASQARAAAKERAKRRKALELELEAAQMRAKPEIEPEEKLHATTPTSPLGAASVASLPSQLAVLGRIPKLRLNLAAQPDAVEVRVSGSVFYELNPDFINPVELAPAYAQLNYDEKLVIVYRLGLGYDWYEIAQIFRYCRFTPTTTRRNHNQVKQDLKRRVEAIYRRAMEKLVLALAECDVVCFCSTTTSPFLPTCNGDELAEECQ